MIDCFICSDHFLSSLYVTSNRRPWRHHQTEHVPNRCIFSLHSLSLVFVSDTKCVFCLVEKKTEEGEETMCCIRAVLWTNVQCWWRNHMSPCLLCCVSVFLFVWASECVGVLHASFPDDASHWWSLLQSALVIKRKTKQCEATFNAGRCVSWDLALPPPSHRVTPYGVP